MMISKTQDMAMNKFKHNSMLGLIWGILWLSSGCVFASENIDGLELQLKALEGTTVEVRVVHKGSTPKFLLNLFDVPFHMLAFKIVDENGNKVKYHGALTKLPFVIENLIYLKPGGFFGMKMDLLKLKRPASDDNKASIGNYEIRHGTYKVKAIYDMRGMKNQFDGVQLWDGRLESEEVTLTIEKIEVPDSVIQ